MGRNIGAQLMTDQAEADKNIAQAKAEERRAMAVAKEQEMRAYTQEMKPRSSKPRLKFRPPWRPPCVKDTWVSWTITA